VTKNRIKIYIIKYIISTLRFELVHLLKCNSKKISKFKFGIQNRRSRK
jgi:hypothetical protein